MRSATLSRIATLLALVGLLVACSGPEPRPDVATPRRAIDVRPHVLVEDEHLLLQRWELEASRDLFTPATELSPALEAYRREIRQRVGETGPADLLRVQLDEDWLPEGDLKNVELALEGEAGRIRPIDRLEAFLLDIQLRRGDMIADPTEFLSLVLQRGDRLKIYFYTLDQGGIGGVGRIHSLVEADVAAGFALERSIHNHNFFFDSEHGVLGGTVPSTADVWISRAQRDEFGLRTATITFDTIELDQDDLDVFQAVGPR